MTGRPVAERSGAAMHSRAKLIVLIGVVMVVGTATAYSAGGRANGLPAANPAATTDQPPVATATVPRAAVERAQELQQRLDENPRDASALAEMVDGLFQAKRYAEAAELLSQAIDAGADTPRLHVGLGVALFYQGMPSLARREMQRAIELDPQNVEAHFNYALTLTHGPRPDPTTARTAWETVVRLDPDGDLGKRAREFLAQQPTGVGGT
jgi:Flp pilus assembly protein TadD